VQGIAHRVLGESLAHEDPDAAETHLRRAHSIFEQIHARNDLAKTLVAQALVEVRRGAPGQARRLLDEAAGIFERLGTIDEPDRVRAALRSLPGGAGG
jgi:hypothetical protein